MDEFLNPDNPNTQTAATVSPDPVRAAEGSVNQTEPATGSTHEFLHRPTAVPASAATSPAVFGRYNVRRSVGAGGFGEVYLGHDTQLDRPVAIKVLRARSLELLSGVARSLQEARKLAQLRHPGIVAVHDIGVHEGQVYIVSDYLEGPGLDRWLQGNHPPWAEAARIVAAVADALSHAHARLIVHRDVKPANIILTAEGGPVLVDFGLALGDEDAGGSAKGLVSGTPWYMSPEQAQGMAHRIDGRTDVYSLGVVLYELLTGRVPFRAATLSELVRQVCDDEPQPPRQLVRDIPPDLEGACLKALSKRQRDRYTTAGDFAEDLCRVLQTAAVASISAWTPTARPAGAPSPTPAAIRADVATPSVRQSSREAERRQLTVLVCGCDAFASYAYMQLDAEEQVRVLRAFQTPCGEAVLRFGGSVVQCTENGLVACFGFPLAYEDAAARAARTGLAVLEAMKTSGDHLRDADTPELKPWVGIHTGLAIVESKEGVVSVVGEARNVALQLEDVAIPGEVICTERSHRLFQGQFHCATVGHHKIKGVSQSIEVFRIQRIATAGTMLDATPVGALSPLTGRDQEIGLLKDRWEQAQEGRGQVVLLIGEPGVGKSRLVLTMKQHVLGHMVEGEVDAPVIEWRCSPYFQNTGLYPGIELFERAFAFGREESPESRFDRMLNRLEQYGLARPETVPLWASLLSLPTPDRFPPLSLSPVRQREEMFRAVLEWLETRASTTPVLFVVEDLHWVDASTLEFLGLFVAAGLHDRILTILTFRPEFETPWPAVGHQTSLALNRLTRRQVGELMQKKTGSALPESLISQMYDRTGGVPLFVEEFTKMMQQSGSPDREGTVFDQTLPGRAVPATLQDLVMARLDRMESEREIAQLAATLGREFTYELIAAVAAVDDAVLQAELAKLIQAEILFPKGKPPRCSYIFKHALLEDALYNALVKGKRRQFHRRIGEVLELQFPQTVESRPELLGHHFTEAAMPQKAIGYWLKAGLRSRERSANAEAIGHLTKGLELLGTLEESGRRDHLELEFLNPLGAAYQAAAGYAATDVVPIFQRARALCERVGAPQQWVAVMWGTWAWYAVRGEFRLCMDLSAEVMKLAERLEDPGISMEALFLPVATRVFRADFAGALECAEQALVKYEDPDRTRFWLAYTGHHAGVTHRCFLALARWHLGYPDQALQISRDALALASRIGHPFSVGFALHNANWLLHHCRLGGELLASAEEQIRLATEQGFAWWLATGTIYRGAALLLQARLHEALPVFLRGLDAYRATGSEMALPHYHSMLGDGYTQAGRFRDARIAMEEGLELAQKNDDRFQEAELHRLKGELLLAERSDQEAAAEECFRAAILIGGRHESKAWELRATMSLARLLQRQGRRADAHHALAAVYGSYTEGFTTPDLVDARATLETLA